MARKSGAIVAVGWALIAVAAIGMLALRAYVTFNPANEVARQPPFAAVLTADACLVSKHGRSKHRTVILKFMHAGKDVVGRVQNFGLIRPDATRKALIALRTGDSVMLNTRERIEGLDEAEVVSVAKADTSILAADQAIAARTAADRRLLHILLGALTAGVACVIFSRLFWGRWTAS
jgi:hypothetical protein